MTSLETSTADTAALYRARGWRPFPLDHPALPACAGLHRPGSPCDDPTKRGKHPVVKYGTATAVEATDKMLALWFHQQGPRNIGIACGPSGLVVIDEDDRNALAMLAADLGEDLPSTYRVQTARGWHYYFEAPTDQTIGNRSGRLAEYHIDVRGGKGMGGYVVAAGSTHHTGHVYVAEDDHVMPAPLPEWLLAEIQAPAGTGDDQGAAPGDADRWDDDVRLGTAAELKANYLRHLAEVQTAGGEFRHELFKAARDAWRLVDLGLLDTASLARDLKAVIARVWGGNDPDDEDTVIAYTEARAAATASPWGLRDPSEAAASPGEGARPDTASLDGLLTSEEQAEIFAQARDDARADKVAEAVERLDIAEEARQVRAERDNPTEPMAAGVLRWSGITSVRPPKMRVRKLIAESAVTWLSGRSGSYKSFLGVAIGLSVATGRDVCGHPDWTVSGTLRVLYVAAEGPAGLSIRAQAYAAHHHLNAADLEDRFLLYPKRVDLRSDGGRRAVRAFAEAEDVGMIVYDTWHKVTPGLDDNSRQEIGEVMSFLDEMRDDLGVESLVVDHTGHAGERATGSSSKVDDADCSLIIKMPGRERTPDVQRTLVVDKLKDAETSGMWDVHLIAVPAVVDDEGNPARVLAVGSLTADMVDLHDDEAWRTTELPSDVADYAGTGKANLNMVARLVMAHGSGLTGISRAEVLARYRAAVPNLTNDTSFARVARAWDALHDLDRLRPVNPTGSSKIAHHMWETDKII